ncbi:hypothetical protein KL905_000566 [Ogataea polymorpha]|uniref:uncharacterized protein n=1 Tax=Ogataea polymorpha TaxID=460523 RepID=UPI0007F4AD7E|nr:uncharacterized protein OGAPODRAFT_76387 [Ogataea polymorpha]KAG7881948.1 hypothetical protein KL937_001571 [Ogataea polymorpha]KAG7894239.1 hypothetical protein KL908_002516 [Ogataea polymorpha]KAG7902192.1 hypothetical protein KL935_002152 [Ogataea polymorpha]KAG7910710.1 hypothetical protein KL907_001601 [Ogataea polymorpha]KAG7911228.1 hypothetical protein KL906_001608 [Ogataea polymorpha]
MSSVNSATVLLNRVLSLKELSPLLLVLDSVIQSSYYLQQELIHKAKSESVPITYLSFETLNRPEVDEFVFCDELSPEEIIAKVAKNTKQLVIIDSINYIPENQLNSFLRGVISPTTVLCATYHTSIPQVSAPGSQNMPTALQRLLFMATTVFELKPANSSLTDEELEVASHKLEIPVGVSNKPVFETKMTYRRKSGRALEYAFIIDTLTHAYEVKQERVVAGDDAELLENLTTFNLTTTQKQKLAREQVDLPFLQAQQSLGAVGGAIVYEFEKDDDYDEDDPYEDPF